MRKEPSLKLWRPALLLRELSGWPFYLMAADNLVDVADLEGGAPLDVILQADAYENHWLEVVSVRDGSARTVFSGLGYYL